VLKCRVRRAEALDLRPAGRRRRQRQAIAHRLGGEDDVGREASDLIGYQRPVRPEPACTSSAITRPPAARTISAARAMNQLARRVALRWRRPSRRSAPRTRRWTARWDLLVKGACPADMGLVVPLIAGERYSKTHRSANYETHRHQSWMALVRKSRRCSGRLAFSMRRTS
jgi:hypothetical protein